jgi:hypothetical protein
MVVSSSCVSGLWGRVEWNGLRITRRIIAVKENIAVRYWRIVMGLKALRSLAFRSLKRDMVSVAGAVVLLAPAVGGAETLDQIARNPVMFDQRTVTVTGLVGQVDTSGGFLLIDGASTVRVVRQGPVGRSVRPGDRVEVYGIFRFGGNTIEAFSVSFR